MQEQNADSFKKANISTSITITACSQSCYMVCKLCTHLKACTLNEVWLTSKIPPFQIDSILVGPDKEAVEIMENSSSQRRSDCAQEKRAFCTATSHNIFEDFGNFTLGRGLDISFSQTHCRQNVGIWQSFVSQLLYQKNPKSYSQCSIVYLEMLYTSQITSIQRQA